MNFCPSCGAKRLRPQDQFCMNCGQPYPKLNTEPAAGTPPQADVQNQAAELTSSIDQMLGGAQSQPGAVPPQAARVQPSQAVAGITQPPAAQAPAQPVAPTPATAIPTQPVEAGPAEPMKDAQAMPEQPGNLFDNGLEAPTSPEVFAPMEAPADSFARPVPGDTAYAEQNTLNGQPLYGEEAPPYAQEAQQPENLFTQPEETLAAGQNTGQAPYGEDLFSGDAQQGAGTQQGAARQQGAGHAEARAAAQADTSHRAAEQPDARQQRINAIQQAAAAQPFADDFGKQGAEQATQTGAGGAAADKWQKLQPGSLDSLYEQDTRKRPPEVQLPPAEKSAPRRKKGGGGRKVGFIITAVLVFVIGTLATTMGMLYYNNSAGKTISTFVKALEENDHTALRAAVQLNGVSASSEGWDALSEAFSTPAARVELERQLKRQASGDAGEETYPALQLKSEPLFLFINSHYIQIQGVEILASGEYEGELFLNDTIVNGTGTDQGLLYGGIMPGTYSYYLQVGGVAIRQGSTTAFQTETPNLLGSSADLPADGEGYTVTVDNCLSDDATLYLNGQELSAKPVGGTVTLNNVPVGGEIRIVANTDSGAQQATVYFSDANTTTLRFEFYTAVNGGEEEEEELEGADADAKAQADALGAADINTVMEAYYRSYLTSINDQTTNTLEHSTGKNTTAMAGRITSDTNKANLYEYVGVACDAESISTGVDEGRPSVKFNATFQFRYTPRDGNEAMKDDSNRQTVHMVYEDGEWKVNAMTFVSDDLYSTHDLAL